MLPFPPILPQYLHIAFFPSPPCPSPELQLEGLKKSIERKFRIPAEHIVKVLKRCHKNTNVTVEIDDAIVWHYSDEDAFVIELTSSGPNHQDTTVVLTEIPV